MRMKLFQHNFSFLLQSSPKKFISSDDSHLMINIWKLQQPYEHKSVDVVYELQQLRMLHLVDAV